MVSVIIPTYNRGDRIIQSVKSVLSQSYKAFELIVVDDGSTDNTEEVIKALKDSRIRYVKKKNGGAASARNYGVACAKYDIIAFQDSDDIWRPNKLEIQLKAMENTGADVVFCRFERHNYASDKGGTSIRPTMHAGMLSFDEIAAESIVSTQTVMAKKKVMEALPFDETLRKMEDYEWAVRAADKYSFSLVDDVLVDVYLQMDSITHRGTDLEYVEKVYVRNQELLTRHPLSCASFLNCVGNYRESCGQSGAKFYWKAFALSKDKKHLAKAALSSLRLAKYFVGRK